MFSELVSFPLHEVEVRGQESGDVTGELRSLKFALLASGYNFKIGNMAETSNDTVLC